MNISLTGLNFISSTDIKQLFITFNTIFLKIIITVFCLWANHEKMKVREFVNDWIMQANGKCGRLKNTVRIA